MLVAKFLQIVKARRRRRTLEDIRREFAKAGYPLDRFRDSQIEMALKYGKDDVGEVILSAKTIYRALRRLRVLTARAETESAEVILSEGIR